MKKIILLALILLLTGCYDYNDLENLGLVSSIIVDKKDDEFITYIELEDSIDESSKPYILESKGKTFAEALNNLYLSSTVKLNYSHLNACMFTKETAESDFEETYDYFTRSSLFRKDFYMFIIDDIDVVKDFKYEKKQSIGSILKNIYENNMIENGNYKTSRFRDYLNQYLKGGYYPVGSVKLKDNTFTFDDVYIFKDNKMVLDVDNNTLLLSNIFDKELKSFLVDFKHSYKIYKYDFNVKVEENRFTLTLKGDVRLLNIDNGNMNSYSYMENLEEEINAYLKKYMSDCIEYSIKQDVDIYNLNYLYYLHYPDKKDKDTWKNLSYRFIVDVNIDEKGM